MSEHHCNNCGSYNNPNHRRTHCCRCGIKLTAKVKPETFYGKDCPNGMVQVEFVGHHSERYSEHGWKPAKSAFIEVYVDGVRYRIDIGDVDGNGDQKRRGLHIVTDIALEIERTAMNSVTLSMKPL